MANEVRIHGLRELTRDFRNYEDDVNKGLTNALKDAAEPVKTDAQSLALSRISNMPASPKWATMRIGVSKARGLVYMMPASRRKTGTPRPTLADELLSKAMDPAVEGNQDQVVAKVEQFLDSLAIKRGF